MMQQSMHDNRTGSAFFRFLGYLPVILPVLAAIFYYGFVASDRYVASASFVIRGVDAPKLDMIGMLTGISGQGQSMEDAHIIKEYMLSRDAVQELRRKMKLDAMFSGDNIDMFSRLPARSSLEDIQSYWKKRITISVEKATGIVILQANAFSPQDALTLVSVLIAAGEERLNILSDRSRQDALAIASKELAASVKNLNAAREKLSAFRMRHKMLDPERTAEARQGIAEKLEEELVAKSVERASLLTYMQPAAPQVTMLDKRIASLRQMLDEENSRNMQALMSNEQGDDAHIVMDAYNQLMIDRNVAEKTYIASVQFMETARLDSMRQRRYISVFSGPQLPEEATEPARLKSIATVFFFTLLIWGILQLIWATVREHRQWNL